MSTTGSQSLLLSRGVGGASKARAQSPQVPPKKGGRMTRPRRTNLMARGSSRYSESPRRPSLYLQPAESAARASHPQSSSPWCNGHSNWWASWLAPMAAAVQLPQCPSSGQHSQLAPQAHRESLSIGKDELQRGSPMKSASGQASVLHAGSLLLRWFFAVSLICRRVSPPPGSPRQEALRLSGPYSQDC